MRTCPNCGAPKSGDVCEACNVVEIDADEAMLEAYGLHEEPGIKGVFTRQRAPGALASGTRVRKCHSLPRDTNADGTPGVVLGSVRSRRGLGYFVMWGDTPKAVLIESSRVEAAPTTRLFRWHRGGLAESMETVVEIADRAALIRHIEREYFFATFTAGTVDPDTLTIAPYGYDERIKWDTWIVCLSGKAIGFTNGPLP